MKTAEQILREICDDLFESLALGCKDGRNAGDLARRITLIETQLIEAFAWHPIRRVDEFGLRGVPDGKMWGPRVIVMMCSAPAIAYWNPDLVQPDGEPVADPSPYWRAVQMTPGWSRKNQPTHFLRPFMPA